MVRNLVLYILGFILLIAINIHYANKTYILTKKDSQIKHILADITYINNPQDQFNYSASPFVLGTVDSKAELLDGRVANLKHFFRKYNSPLYDYADVIVKVSDENQFDYRLLPAIAMQESNVCKYIPNDSYNCWGWGIYGNTVTRFSSYEEAIDTVARGIKKEYIDKGLITASSIMEKYTPSSNGSWAHGVNIFLQMLE